MAAPPRARPQLGCGRPPPLDAKWRDAIPCQWPWPPLPSGPLSLPAPPSRVAPRNHSGTRAIKGAPPRRSARSTVKCPTAPSVVRDLEAAHLLQENRQRSPAFLTRQSPGRFRRRPASRGLLRPDQAGAAVDGRDDYWVFGNRGSCQETCLCSACPRTFVVEIPHVT